MFAPNLETLQTVSFGKGMFINYTTKLRGKRILTFVKLVMKGVSKKSI